MFTFNSTRKKKSDRTWVKSSAQLSREVMPGLKLFFPTLSPFCPSLHPTLMYTFSFSRRKESDKTWVNNYVLLSSEVMPGLKLFFPTLSPSCTFLHRTLMYTLCLSKKRKLEASWANTCMQLSKEEMLGPKPFSLTPSLSCTSLHLILMSICNLRMRSWQLNRLEFRPLKCKRKWIRQLLRLMPSVLNNKLSTKNQSLMMIPHLSCKVLWTLRRVSTDCHLPSLQSLTLTRSLQWLNT